METPASLASGQGGKPLGTERLSARPSFVQTRPGASGQMFAREVERAVERTHGDGLQEKRLDELEGQRREARRAGFGRMGTAEDGAEGEARTVEVVFRPEHAPVGVQPAHAPRLPGDGLFQSTPESVAPSTCSPCAEQRPGAPVDSVSQPSAQMVPIPSATQTPVTGAVPHLAPELPALPGTAHEVQSIELPQLARPGSKAAQPATSPLPTPGPDPAVLERAAEILRQIQLHAAPGIRRLTLDLEPAELGRLSVQLALRAGKVAAIVRGENSETLELLQQRESELLQVLAQRGITADAVRFELGFSDSRRPRAAHASTPAVPVLPAPASSIPCTAPRDRAALIDLYA